MKKPIFQGLSAFAKASMFSVGFALCAVLVFSFYALGREKTVGEQFRKVMADIDSQCKKEKKGPYLDPRDPEYRNKRLETQCDILKLKPSDPLATPEGRFAHSIKPPPPHDKPKEVYKPGMTGEKYFSALCEAEAGEFVFRTVKNVEGVLQLRPYTYEGELLGYLFAYEGISGPTVAMSNHPQGYLIGDRRNYYNFFDVSITRGPGIPTKVEHWTPIGDRKDEKRTIIAGDVSLPHQKVMIDKSVARYGYTQRGIRRHDDREHGIRGAELIVLDIQTNDIIAFRRVFRRYHFNTSYLTQRQLFVEACPVGQGGYEFIQKVLKSINHN